MTLAPGQDHPRWSKAWILQHLDGSAEDRRVALAIGALIVTSCVLIAVETVPEIHARHGSLLLGLEFVFLMLFALEYITRLICSPSPLGYAFSFWGIVDLLACLPALLFLMPDLQVLRSLRLVRMIRLLKLFRLSHALDRVERAFYAVRDELAVFVFLSMLVLFLAAVGIYHFEHAAQPDVFSSIPASLWWALATLTTVGYGDVYPVTGGGKAFTGLVLLVGLGVVAVPAGVVTAALLAEGDAPAPPRTTHSQQGDTE